MNFKKPENEEEAKLIVESLYHIGCSNSPTGMGHVPLEDVHDVFKKWFHITDTNRLDVVLAVALSQKQKGIPLWMIIIAPSGDMKSEQLRALNDNGASVKVVPRMSDKTLVNGFRDKEKCPDFAPKLDGKIMMIMDMAEILQLRADVKNEVWAQLRTLYDGEAGVASGMGTDVYYKDLYVTFLGASTPAIDDQILIHQSLGSRELVYRPKELVDVNKLMEKAWFNEDFEEMMRKEIAVVCRGFMDAAMQRKIDITPEVKEKIMALTLYLTKMRAATSIDSYSGDLRSNVTPERPTRLLKQLKRLFVCLKSLDYNYPDETALEIIKEVVMSSVVRNRQLVLKLLVDYDTPLTTSEVADRIRIGKKTAKQELNILWNMGIVDRRVEENTTPWGETRIVKEEWSINKEDATVKFLLKPRVDEQPKTK